MYVVQLHPYMIHFFALRLFMPHRFEDNYIYQNCIITIDITIDIIIVANLITTILTNISRSTLPIILELYHRIQERNHYHLHNY